MKDEVPVVPPKKRVQIQIIAKSFLERWLPDAADAKFPVEVDYLFDVVIPENYGIQTGYTDLSRCGMRQEILGFTDAETKKSWITSSLADSTGQSDYRRFRATVAHEVGHCILHVPYLERFTSASIAGHVELFRASRSEIPAYVDPEWQAWEFGGELLMPYDVLREMADDGYTVYDLANHFDVNPKFVEVRCAKLKIRLL